MADISFSHPHGLSLDEAKTKTKQIVDDVQGEFPSLIQSIDWNADQTHAKLKGKGFDGTFQVTDAAMNIEINLGMLTRPFKGKVQEKIQSRVSKYFS